ncbi:hypothetical protein EIP86_005126 [Pleurotus ostreatoroseus]|nr:hypothetical protein EIP86_005126 [Pleurotus ostreatoroseus]
MNGSKTPNLSMRSPYRRRRILWSIFLGVAVFLFYIGTHPSFSIGSWSLPAYLKDGSSSPAGLISEAKAKAEATKQQVAEIDALLYFVTAYPDRTLVGAENAAVEVKGMGSVKVNPDEPIDLRVYAPDGDDDWEQHLEVLRKEHPLVIFSKTYCQYSKKAKALLLDTYHLSPPPSVVEIDTRLDGAYIQTILMRLTSRKTVPNIILNGQSLGGLDDIHQLDDDNKLETILQEGGLTVTVTNA